MKRLIALSIILIGFNFSLARQPFSTEMSFDVFYTNLSPYGEWIEIERGVIVWHPTRVDYDWQPYSNGMWTYTDFGWYWDSYEPFGWATAHYGRWFLDDYYGWIWFPDNEWGPAWVEWRHGNNHIGWAPLPPYAKFSRHSGIVFSVKWHSNYKHWHFVNYSHFGHKNVAKYYQPKYYNKHIFGKTKYRNNYEYRNNRIYNAGIDRNIIEKQSRTKFRKVNVDISNSIAPSKNRRQNNNSVVSYRPTEVKTRNNEFRNIRQSDRTSTVNRDKIEVGTNYTNRKEREATSRERVNQNTESNKRNNINRSREIVSKDLNIYVKPYDDKSRNQKKVSHSSRTKTNSDTKTTVDRSKNNRVKKSR